MKNIYIIWEVCLIDINFEYYKIFYYAAKYGNITRAAAALGGNQPNVTRVLKILESQLNCRLFIRGARGVGLTEEGERLYSHVEVAYRQFMNAQEELCGQDAKRSGTVEIGATETALHLFLLDMLHDFKKEYPAVRIKIHNHTTPEIIRQMMAGKADFAVVTAPFQAAKVLCCENVMDFEEILTGGMQYSHLCSRVLEPEEIGRYAWIGLGRGTATYEFYKDFFVRHNLDLELDMEVATADLMLPLIEHNLGIGFVPKQLAMPLLREQRLVEIKVRWDNPARCIQIVSDRGRGKSFAANTFYKYLKEEGRQNGLDGNQRKLQK